MGLLDFIGGIANTITGARQNKKALAWEKEQCQQEMH